MTVKTHIKIFILDSKEMDWFVENENCWIDIKIILYLLYKNQPFIFIQNKYFNICFKSGQSLNGKFSRSFHVP